MNQPEFTQEAQQQIAVFDLDGTLLEGDSFRFFLSRFLKDPPVALTILAYGALRGLRLISRQRFFEGATRAARGSRHYQQAVQRTVAWCREHWRPRVIDHAEQFAGREGVQRIIVSASPHDYVAKLEELLGGRCYGSTLDGTECAHLFGAAKRDWLVSHFEPRHYRYLVAYGDSRSDGPLVELFQGQFRVATASGEITRWGA